MSLLHSIYRAIHHGGQISLDRRSSYSTKIHLPRLSNPSRRELGIDQNELVPSNNLESKGSGFFEVSLSTDNDKPPKSDNKIQEGNQNRAKSPELYLP